MTLLPKPDAEFAKTIRAWDNRPDVEIWFPNNSASGEWEALVGSVLVQEKSMLRFVNLVSAAIAAKDEADARARAAAKVKEADPR